MAIQLIEGSTPGKSYSVDTDKLTCTCRGFQTRLRNKSMNDPHRLCKHLIKAVQVSGIPNQFEEVREDIELCAKYNSRFTTKDKVYKENKIPLPKGSIQTITCDKKIKYCYITGKVFDNVVYAALPLKDHNVSLTINNYHGSANLKDQLIAVPKTYKYMEDAILEWILDERDKLLKGDTP